MHFQHQNRRRVARAAHPARFAAWVLDALSLATLLAAIVAVVVAVHG